MILAAIHAVRVGRKMFYATSAIAVHEWDCSHQMDSEDGLV